jgi:hypothetical protein
MHAASMHPPSTHAWVLEQLDAPQVRGKHIPPPHTSSAPHVTPKQDLSIQTPVTQTLLDPHAVPLHALS